MVKACHIKSYKTNGNYTNEVISTFLKAKNFVEKNNLMSLSGISNSKIIFCNEDDFYSTYNSDRHGLNNPDHVWDKKDFIEELSKFSVPVLRPLNYPDITPGRGAIDIGPIAVINLIGRVFMGEYDSPFTAIDNLLSTGFGKGKPIFVDLHAETTSEKAAMGWYLDGKVTALVGTHTHVPTADAQLFPGGTGYMSDTGMCGDYNSVIGMNRDNSLKRFLKDSSVKKHYPALGKATISGLMVQADDETGLAKKIEPIIVGGVLENKI